MSKVLIGLDKSGSFRVYITDTTDIVKMAQDIHLTTPLASAGLGRVLTGAGIMSVMLKNPTDRMTMIFKGDGPAKQILAVGSGEGVVKGYIANPDCNLPLKDNGKLDVGGSLGIGELTIIKDLGLKEPYSGTIALVSGEIAEDLTAYHFISEQQNTSIALGVKVDVDALVSAAGGMLIQMLPDATDGSIDALEAMLPKIRPITSYVEEARAKMSDEEKGSEKELELMKDAIFADIDPDYMPETLEFRDLEWACDCSKEKMAKALMTIGKADLTEILEEDGQAELGCQFCNSKYTFTREELEEMLERM